MPLLPHSWFSQTQTNTPLLLWLSKPLRDSQPLCQGIGSLDADKWFMAYLKLKFHFNMQRCKHGHIPAYFWSVLPVACESYCQVSKPINKHNEPFICICLLKEIIIIKTCNCPTLMWWKVKGLVEWLRRDIVDVENNSGCSVKKGELRRRHTSAPVIEVDWELTVRVHRGWGPCLLAWKVSMTHWCFFSYCWLSFVLRENTKRHRQESYWNLLRHQPTDISSELEPSFWGIFWPLGHV